MNTHVGKLYKRIGSYIAALVLAISGTSIAWPVFFSQVAGAYSYQAEYLQVNPDNSAPLTQEFGYGMTLFNVKATETDDSDADAIELGYFDGVISANISDGTGKIVAVSDCSLADWLSAGSSASVTIQGSTIPATSYAQANFCYKGDTMGDHTIDFSSDFPFWTMGLGHGHKTPAKSVTISVLDTTPPGVPVNGVSNIVSGTGNHVDFSWGVVDNDLGSPISHYVFQILGDVERGIGTSNLDTLITVEDIPDGLHYWHVKTVDAAGQESAWSDDFEFTIDTIAPSINIVNPSSDPAQSKTVTATTETGATLEMVVNEIATPNCDEAVTGFVPYADMTFSSESDNGETVCYRATDSVGNKMLLISSPIAGIDTTAPVITLNGVSPMKLEVGGVFVDPGATTDDGSVVTATGTVDMAATGTYTVTYNSADAAGNNATPVERTVIVEDTTKPLITLLGDASVTIEQGTAYTDAGATALDNYDGDLTGKIETVNPVNTAVLGEYTITFNVTDASGNVADEITRIVKVIAATVIPQTPVTTPTPEATTTAPVETEVFGTTTGDETTTSDISTSDGSTDEKSDPAEVKSATDKKDSGWFIIGLAWYWWLIIVALAAAIWWFIAARRRKEDEKTGKK